MITDEQIGIAHKIPEWEEIFRIMPIAFGVITVVVVGAVLAWFFMSQHISSLKDIIEYLKARNKE